MKRCQKHQTGFTMIELIVVIAIIGILAAIAVPRFINQISGARIAALNGLSGAINSAVELAQAEYIAEGNSSASTATSITMNGAIVTVVAGTGRPIASAVGIGDSTGTGALQTVSGFTATFAAPLALYDFSTAVSDCNVVYNSSTGAVTLTTIGC